MSSSSSPPSSSPPPSSLPTSLLSSLQQRDDHRQADITNRQQAKFLPSSLSSQSSIAAAEMKMFTERFDRECKMLERDINDEKEKEKDGKYYSDKLSSLTNQYTSYITILPLSLAAKYQESLTKLSSLVRAKVLSNDHKEGGKGGMGKFNFTYPKEGERWWEWDYMVEEEEMKGKGIQIQQGEMEKITDIQDNENNSIAEGADSATSSSSSSSSSPLSSTVSSSSPSPSTPSSPPTPLLTPTTISHFSHRTFIRYPGSLSHREVHLRSLSHCTIYIFDTPRIIHIHDITHCNIYIGPISNSVLLYDATHCHLHLSAQQLRLHNCHECVFNVWSSGWQPPIVENASKVTFSMYGMRWTGEEETWKESKLVPNMMEMIREKEKEKGEEGKDKGEDLTYEEWSKKFNVINFNDHSKHVTDRDGVIREFLLPKEQREKERMVITSFDHLKIHEDEFSHPQKTQK